MLWVGATVVEVRFKNCGAELIEIVDNGSGIAPANHHAIVTHHHSPVILASAAALSPSSMSFSPSILPVSCVV
jgi:hypothetical protein